MTRKINRASVLTATLLVAGLAITGCSGGGGSTPDITTGNEELDQLIAAAQEEGEVIWYQTGDERSAEALGSAFEEKYGITATYARATSADLEQRFTAEQQSGAPSADVIMPLAGEFFQKTLDEGWVTPLDESGIPEYPPEQLPQSDAIEGSIPVSASAYGIGINTDEVADGDIESWEDLLDPKWKGRIQLVDPATSPNYVTFWYLVAEKYGMDFLTKLRGQVERIQSGSTGITQSLAAGEAAIAVPAVTAVVEPTREEGAPVDFLTSDPGLTAPTVPGIVTNAEHPNAAKLLVYFLLTDEGLDAFNSVPGFVLPQDATQMGTSTTIELEDEADGHKAEILAALGF